MGPRAVATSQDRNSCSGTSAGSRERSSWVGNLNYKCLLSHNQTKSSIYVLDVTSLLIRWGFVYKNTGQALDYPFLVPERGQVTGKSGRIAEWSEVAEELEFTGTVDLFQRLEKQSAEEGAEDFHGEEEFAATGNP